MGVRRLTNLVDGAGTTRYTYTAAGQLLTETGPFASDTVTNIYWNRLRVNVIANSQSPIAREDGKWQMANYGPRTTDYRPAQTDMDIVDEVDRKGDSE